MSQWQNNKRWSDRFLPEVKAILGAHLIGEAPVEEDQRRNTDLIVLRLEAVRICVRIRQFKYWSRYSGQFTVRSSLPSGMQTELDKIISGWGDYNFYAYANQAEDRLYAWLLGDLRVFRLWFNRQLARGQRPWLPRANADGSSDFCAFRVADLPPEFVVATNDVTVLSRAG